MNGLSSDLQFIGGVHVSLQSQEKFSDFETHYLTVREKEKRVLTLEEIRHLPYPEKGSVDYNLWKVRRKNIKRFIRYLAGKGSLRILDIGCGNGFFTNLLASGNNQVVGVDVNLTELTQAANAFPGKKINWYYIDILNESLPEKPFDLITFCTSFHYFSDPNRVLDICLKLLRPGGEIHIIDSPFYSEQARDEARKNSAAYFSAMKAEPMSQYYHHNTLACLKDYPHTFKYKPRRFLTRFLNDSPFPWIMIGRSN